MSRANRLSKNPTLLTVLLSAATVAGYVSYRLTDGTAAAQDTDPSHSAALWAAAALPDIVLDDLAGTPTALASFAGRPLLVNFWATWCAPCLREIPLLKAFHEEHGDIDVIGIAVDRLDPVLEYAEAMQFNYPVLVGQSAGMDAMAAFRNDAGAMPFSVFITADGAILANHAGELHAEHLAELATAIDRHAAGAIDLAAAREQLAAAFAAQAEP